MNKKTLLTLGFSLYSLAAPAAMADFIDSNADDAFQSETESFGSSLDNTASRQRRETDYSNMSAAHRTLVNSQSNQTDTWKTSQDAFNNTQKEMVLSGGAYNNQGFIWGGAGLGSGWGNGGGGMYGSGGGSNLTPDSWGQSQPPTFNSPSFGGRYYGRRRVSTNND